MKRPKFRFLCEGEALDYEDSQTPSSLLLSSSEIAYQLDTMTAKGKQFGKATSKTKTLLIDCDNET